MLYRRPSTLDEAIAELGEDDALPLAGGTSLALLMNLGLIAPGKLVSLNAIPELRGIATSDGTVEIGALTTHAEIATDPQLCATIPAVRDAFGRVGNVRIRAWGTVGGNLAQADPASDPPVLLSALGAEVVAVGPDGERRIAVSAFADGPFSTALAPAEILTKVVLPVPAPATRSSYIKFLPRTAEDYATVTAAAALQLDDRGLVRAASLVLGSVGPAPVLCDRAAALIGGQRLDDQDVLDAVASAVRETVTPTSDGRGSADYKRQVAGVIACRALTACVPNCGSAEEGRP